MSRYKLINTHHGTEYKTRKNVNSLAEKTEHSASEYRLITKIRKVLCPGGGCSCRGFYKETQIVALTPHRKRLRDVRKAAGSCPGCGGARTGALYCIKCRGKHKRWLKARYAARKAAGQCPGCGSRELNGMTYCLKCRESLKISQSKWRSK